jgi:hypothetical protein
MVRLAAELKPAKLSEAWLTGRDGKCVTVRVFADRRAL